METLKKILTICSILILITACKMTKPTFTSVRGKQTIIIENDSIIRYTKLYGHLGSSMTMNYYKTDRNILLIENGNDTIIKNGKTYLSNHLYGESFVIYSDSLINRKSGQIYYSEKYIKSKENKKFIPFYIILENKKQKITKSNFKRILTNINLEEYKSAELNKKAAKKKYGIDKKYTTIELVKKKSEIIQTDYSQSAKQAIELIKEKILSKNISEFGIEIESKHNGTYISKTQIKKIENKIKVNTQIFNASGKNTKSENVYTIREFLASLDKLISSAENQLVIAGTYQKIKIIDNEKELVFHTRKALGLMNMMR